MFSKKRADSTKPIIIPTPIVVAPSGQFDGNDGKWSTFTINIGDSGEENGIRGQNFRVLVSTSSPLTLVPGQADWCDLDCAKERGVEIFNAKQPRGFQSSSSKSWKPQGIFNIPLPYWWTGTKSGAFWGSDNVGLGEGRWESTILGSQIVVESEFEDLYMGSFGLAAGAVNAGGSQFPFLTNLAGSNNTPSISYGYTAGAIYRNNRKRVPGNLVLGGFDQSRMSSQTGTSITMPPAGNSSLVVGVQSIIYQPNSDIDSKPYSFTADRPSGTAGFSATIDSTLPYLWLPDDICDEFADKFQLQFDQDTELYTVNKTAHEYNLKQNAAVSFKIGDGPSDSLSATTITLPYGAFDLQADRPIFPNQTDYFPIRKSKNGIFVLGRAFLQEAYIVVDYERANFTVAPAVFSDPMPQEKLVPIYKKDFVLPTASPTASPTVISDKKGGLAPGAVAGIVVGIVILFLLLGLGAFFFWKRRRATQRKGEKQDISEIDTRFTGAEIKQPHMSELDSEPQGKPPGGYYGVGGHNNKDMPFPPVSEMESPPAEMYSPPTQSAQLSATPTSERKVVDYFTKPRRRGATRQSSGSNTPGTPGIHELPGDYGQYQVGSVHFDRMEGPQSGTPLHSRGPSDTSLGTNIDEVISGQQRSNAGVDAQVAGPERRPSHARGASDTTIQSDTTAVSQPTPEEMANWALEGTQGPRRPLSD